MAAITANAQWQQGNGINGGTVHCLAVKDTIILAGTDTGGVFISTDDGLNWTASNNGLPEKNVVALLVKGNTIVAALGNGFSSGCFFISTDNGASWTPAANQYFGVVFTMVLNGQDILAGTWFGVARSVNDGNSWSTLSTNGLPSNASVSAIVVNSGNLYAGVSSSSAGGTGVFLSANSGTDWSAKNTGLTNTVVTAMAAFDGKIYAGTNGGRVFSSADNGENWTSSSTGITNTSVQSLHQGGAHLYTGTNGGVFITTNGTDWKSINANLPANTAVHSIITINGYVYVGTGETIYRRSLSEVNTGLILLPEPVLTEIYPNPANGKFTVTLTKPAANISVINMLGETVYTSGAVESNTAVIELGSAVSKAGMYFVKIEGHNGISTTHRVVIE